MRLAYAPGAGDPPFNPWRDEQRVKYSLAKIGSNSNQGKKRKKPVKHIPWYQRFGDG